MIPSMTAFGGSEIHNSLVKTICEIRTVNHRYPDINIHCTEALLALETEIRQRIANRLKRGKIDCYLHSSSNTKKRISNQHESSR